MAIWKHNGLENVKAAFYQKNLGLDVYLCCPGPSLNEVDKVNINTHSAYVAAMNTAFPKVKPNIWFGMDRPACYHPDLLFNSCIKIFRGGYSKIPWNGRLLREYPNTFFCDHEVGKVEDIPKLLQPESKFIWTFNTFTTTIHILIWMGAKKIHLVGCDFGGRYFDGRKLPPKNEELYRKTITFLNVLNKENTGVEFISCTPKSPINSFLKYMPLKEALSKTEENARKEIPQEINIILPGPDAGRTVWREAITDNEGVVVLVDKNVEWMLPWWFGRYRRYNNYPVLFVDNGMTIDGVKFCKRYGRYFNIAEASKRALPIQGWYMKPFAILCSPFRRTLFLDLDCEVHGELDPVFMECEEKGLALHYDKPWSNTKQHKEQFGDLPAYNSGVVSVKHGNKFIEQWAIAITNGVGKYYGDQDYLTNIIKPEDISILPQIFNRLRLDEQCNGNPVISHWSGPLGKEKIKNELRPIDRAFDAPDRAVELYRRLQGKGPLAGAEVGVFYGRTSTYLLNMIPDLKMYLIDPWKTEDADSRYVKSGDATAKFDQAYMNKAAQYVEYSTMFAQERRETIRDTSLNAVSKFEHVKLDFVFIDADHTYEGCKEDIEAWWFIVEQGGMLCGHDFNNQPDKEGEKWGVKKAVEEFVEKHKDEIELQDGKLFSLGMDYTWFVTKKGKSNA